MKSEEKKKKKRKVSVSFNEAPPTIICEVEQCKNPSTTNCVANFLFWNLGCSRNICDEHISSRCFIAMKGYSKPVACTECQNRI